MVNDTPNTNYEPVEVVEANMRNRLHAIQRMIRSGALEFIVTFNVDYVLALFMLALALGAQLSPNTAFFRWLAINHGYTANFWSWLLSVAALGIFAIRHRGTIARFVLALPLFLILIYVVNFLEDTTTALYSGQRDYFGLALQAGTAVAVAVILLANRVVDQLKNGIVERERKIIALEAKLKAVDGGNDAADTPAQ